MVQRGLNMDQRSWFNQLYRNEPPGPMIPNNAPPMPMDMGGGGMVGYEPQQVQNPIGAFDDPIRLGMAKLRKSEIKPTEYVASETKPDVLEHAKVEDDSKSLLDSHIKSLADHANAGMSVSSDNNRIGSIEDMYGLNVYRPKSTGEKVMDFIGGFAPTVIAGLGSMADPDNGAYGLGSTDAALKQLNFYQNQAQNDKNKALDIRAGLLKDDDLLGAYGKTRNAYESPNPPSMEVDRYLMQQLMQNQAMKKTPADFQPYLLETYDPETGQYDMNKSLTNWRTDRNLQREISNQYKDIYAQLAIQRLKDAQDRFNEGLKDKQDARTDKRLAEFQKKIQPAQALYDSFNEVEAALGYKLDDYNDLNSPQGTVAGKEAEVPGTFTPLGRVSLSQAARTLDDAVQRVLNKDIRAEAGLNQTAQEAARLKVEMGQGKLRTKENYLNGLKRLKTAMALDMRNTEYAYKDIVDKYEGTSSKNAKKLLDLHDLKDWALSNPNDPDAQFVIKKYKLK